LDIDGLIMTRLDLITANNNFSKTSKRNFEEESINGKIQF